MDSALSTHQPFQFQVHTNRSLIDELLADKRSANTRRAYAKDLHDFFTAIAPGQELTPQLVGDFLRLERATAIALTLQYKAHLIERHLAEATVNRRLAAVKSLVKYAQKVGKCEWSLEEVSGERLQSYRDTTGVDATEFKKLLAIPNRTTAKGKRDYALLRLLWDNVLRRNEVVSCNVKDFNPTERTLSILGKGRGSQRERVSLSMEATGAIADWLAIRGQSGTPDAPLFVALNPSARGKRLTGDGLYYLVETLAKQAGIEKRLSPHRCRHSGITTALELTGGDICKVQKLSRHKRVETVMIYWDNYQNVQADVTDLLSEAV